MSNLIQSNQVITLPAVASITNLISATDSGKIVIIPTQLAAQTFTLPLPSPGLCYKFIVNGLLGFNVTISTNPISLFYGNLYNKTTAPISTAMAAANAGVGTQVNFNAAKGGATFITFLSTATIGTMVDVVSDGNYWYVNGLWMGAGITLATGGLNYFIFN